MTAQAQVEGVFREEYARIVASLVRRFGDIDVAEEAAGEALLRALEKWPVDGTPPNPGGWLTTTAGNLAIDRLRREGSTRRQAPAGRHGSRTTRGPTVRPPPPTGPVTDDRLRLVFTCCHPALATEARVALTLRLIAGLTVPEIARAFLVPETTLAQRLTRAKKKIKDAQDPLPRPGGRRPAHPADGRARGGLPGLQRGVRRLGDRGGGRPHPGRPVRGGHPAGPAAARADAARTPRWPGCWR